MKKKILWLGLSFLLVAALVLVSCGPEVAPGEQEEEEEEEEEEPVVEEPTYQFYVVSHGSIGDPFHAVVKLGSDTAAKRYGVEVTTFYAEGDVARMIELAELAIVAEVDGLIIALADEALNPVTQRAVDAGIPVISFNIDQPDNPRLAFVGQDLYKGGFLLGTKMGELLPEGGHVVLPAEIPGMTYAVLRNGGAMDAMEALDKSFTYEILDAGYEVGLIYDRLTAYLLGHPETKGIVTAGGLTTAVAGTVIKDLGLTGQIVHLGHDLLEETVGNIKAGRTYGTLDQQQYLQGYIPVVQLYLLLEGLLSPVDYPTGVELIDITTVYLVEDLVALGIR